MSKAEVLIDRPTYLSDGTKVIATIIDPIPYSPPGQTELHEAEHAIPAIDKVVEISSIPERNSLGHTRFSSFDAAAAGAPHANGRRGTSFDLWLIQAHGHNISSAIAAGGAALSGKEKHVNRLAGALAVKREMSGSEAKKVYDRVENGESVIVIFERKDGTTEETVEHGVKEEVLMIEYKEYELPKAA